MDHYRLETHVDPISELHIIFQNKLYVLLDHYFYDNINGKMSN